MSISISTLSSVFIEFVTEALLPVIDKNKSSYTMCMGKWQEFMESVLKRISNFHSEDQLKERLNFILHKFTGKERAENYAEVKQDANFGERTMVSRANHGESDKLKFRQQEEMNTSQENVFKEDVIQFRDRKTSLDEFSARKQKKQQSQIRARKDQRSGSVNLVNGIDGDSMSEVPLAIITSPSQHDTRQRNGSYIRKQNEVMSFNSISDFHRSRNSIPHLGKEVKDPEGHEVKLGSRKSIEDFGVVGQSKGNSYSSNYIESIKKISLQSRSPNDKPKSNIRQQLQSAGHDFIENTPVKLIQNTQVGGSAISNIKKKISQGSQYIGSPSLGPQDSFGKFLNSFKKLCNTFESNHHKLMREDFNNKYINC